MTVSDQVAIYVVDGTAYAFSGKLGKWDSVAASAVPQLSNETALLVEKESIAAFSASTGQWAVAEIGQ